MKNSIRFFPIDELKPLSEIRGMYVFEYQLPLSVVLLELIDLRRA